MPFPLVSFPCKGGVAAEALEQQLGLSGPHHSTSQDSPVRLVLSPVSFIKWGQECTLITELGGLNQLIHKALRTQSNSRAHLLSNLTKKSKSNTFLPIVSLFRPSFPYAPVLPEALHSCAPALFFTGGQPFLYGLRASRPIYLHGYASLCTESLPSVDKSSGISHSKHTHISQGRITYSCSANAVATRSS